MKKCNQYCFPKLSTGIIGLDKILYGGIDINNEHPVIVIMGDEDVDKTLLALQIVYGLSQSVKRIGKDYKELMEMLDPVFYSTSYSANILNEMLLDYFISSCMQEVMKKKAAKDSSINWTADIFTRLLFDNEKILCSDQDNCLGIPFSAISAKPDSLIGDNILYYNNRTNSLHFKTSVRTSDDKYNQIYNRRFNTVSDYAAYYRDSNRFSNQTQLYTYAGLDFIPFEMKECRQQSSQLNYILDDFKADMAKTGVVGIDLSGCHLKDHEVEFIELLDRVHQSSFITVIVTGLDVFIPEGKADIIIKLSPKQCNDYTLKNLTFVKSALQDCMFGVHQYKRRDYGIEIYPRLGRYIHERRYLQRALVYTHSDAVTDTFQQYLKRQKYYINSPVNMYEDYEKERNLKLNSYLQSIYPEDVMGLVSIDLLNKIFMPPNPLRHLLYKPENENEHEKEFLKTEYMYGHSSFVTAVIGASNTYKRFLTFGSIFGSSVVKDHTLIIMMNKEESVIRRRLMCPARQNSCSARGECRECYRHIHFMNICMGYITPEELLYFIERQIEVTYEGDLRRQIRRIVIDDLQILDFCFPLLKDNGLFLAALAELCRENDIILYILCDSEGRMASSLKSLADNVIFTDKDDEGHPLVFVEKFAGYNISPSKMYCGRVRDVEKLFRCVESYDAKGIRHIEFLSSIVELEDRSVNNIRKMK